MSVGLWKIEINKPCLHRLNGKTQPSKMPKTAFHTPESRQQACETRPFVCPFAVGNTGKYGIRH